MRTPYSGNQPTKYPSFSSYRAQVLYGGGRPTFSANSGMGNGESQFLDLANAGDVSLVSVDTDKIWFYRSGRNQAVYDWATAACWTKATLYTADPGDGTPNTLRYAMWVDKAYLGQFQEDVTTKVQWGTKPGITRDGSGGFKIAYFEEGDTGIVRFRSLWVTSGPTGPVVNIAEDAGTLTTGLTGTLLEGATISWADPWNVIVFYKDSANRPWMQHWNIWWNAVVTKLAEVRLSPHGLSDWWRMTDCSATQMPDPDSSTITFHTRRFVLSFPWKDDMPATREYQEAAQTANDNLGEPIFVTGGFDDYATVQARLFNMVRTEVEDHPETQGETNTYTLYTAMMEHAFLDGNDAVAAKANVVMYSFDARNWHRWVGLDVVPLRGGIGNVEDQTILVGADAMYLGTSTTLTHGKDAWSTMVGASSIEIEAQAGSTVPSISVEVDDLGLDAVSPGDHLRVFYKVLGANLDNPPAYILGSFGVDALGSDVAYEGRQGSLEGRGYARRLVDYGAIVDEELAKVNYRKIDFSTYPMVAKRGIWNWDENAKTVEITDFGTDDGGTAYTHGALFTASKLDPGDFQVILHADTTQDDCGVLFYGKDEENFWAVIQHDNAGTQEIVLVKMEFGVQTVLHAATAVGGVDMMRIEVRGDKIRVYTRDLSDAPLYDLNVMWTHEFDYTDTDLHVESHHVGVYARTVGYKLRALYLNNYGHALTVGMVARMLGLRSGVRTEVRPYHLAYSQTTYTVDNDSGAQTFTIDTGVDANNLVRKPIQHLDMEAMISQANPYCTTTIYWTPYYTNDSSKWGDGGWRLMFIGGDASDQREYLLQKGTYDSGTGTMNWETLYRANHSDDDLIYNYYRLVVAREESKDYSTLRLYHFGRENIHIPLDTTYDRGYVQIHISLQPNPSGNNGYSALIFGPLRIDALGYPVNGYVWPYNRPAMDEIRQLIEPFMYELVEDPMGRAIIRTTDLDYDTDYVTAYLGTTDLAYLLTVAPNDTDWASIVKMTGAEVYSYYVDPELILLGAKPVEFDSAYLWSVEECTEMAKRRARFLRSTRDRKIYTGILDPRVEIQDAIDAQNETRIVSNYTMRISHLLEEPVAEIVIDMRDSVDYNIIQAPDG